jgi:UDP-glucose 4-epimerase
MVLVSSGGVVYGHSNTMPISEGHPTNPISPYGITKLAVEKYAQLFHSIHELPVLCVRPGNAYGPSQIPFVGQGFVATAIASILSGSEICLFGESGTIRDYIHVEDVASGIVAALSQGQPGDVYNIGSGEGRSNRDILDALQPLAQEIGLEVRLNTQPLRKFDVPRIILDSSKLQAVSGWKARTPFTEGIRGTWEWYRAQRGPSPENS